MDLNNVFWVPFVDLALCVLFSVYQMSKRKL